VPLPLGIFDPQNTQFLKAGMAALSPALLLLIIFAYLAAIILKGFHEA
jgi:hypothetical protein